MAAKSAKAQDFRLWTAIFAWGLAAAAEQTSIKFPEIAFQILSLPPSTTNTYDFRQPKVVKMPKKV